MEFSYLITPFLTWFLTGIVKFLTNSIKLKKISLSHIGYGGMPSNHSSIVSSMATLIALKEGVESSAFGASIALAFIVILDANGLRQELGKHAKIINKINSDHSENYTILRERMGHTRSEIAVGILFGMICAFFINSIT